VDVELMKYAKKVLGKAKLLYPMIATEGELTSGRPGLSTIFQLRPAARCIRASAVVWPIVFLPVFTSLLVRQ
jgi:hypothetical protein